MLIINNRKGILSPKWVVTQDGVFVFGMSPRQLYLTDSTLCRCGGSGK